MLIDIAGTLVALYIDNTAILVRPLRVDLFVSKMRLTVDALHGWFCKCRVIPCADKSAAVLCHQKRSPSSLHPVNLNDARLS